MTVTMSTSSSSSPSLPPPPPPPPPSVKSIMSMMLIRVLLSCFLTPYLLQQNITQILDQDAKYMERWDPSDIISQSFPIHNLRSHVYTTSLLMILVSTSLYIYENKKGAGEGVGKGGQQSVFLFLWKSVWNYILMMGVLFLITLFSIILSGASLDAKYIQHTILASLYMTILAFGYSHPPPLLSSGSGSASFNNNNNNNNDTDNKSNKVSIDKRLNYILIHLLTGEMDYNDDNQGQKESEYQNDNDSTSNNESNDEARYDNGNSEIESDNNSKTGNITNTVSTTDQMNRYIMYSTIFTTIPFQILNILDHGDQIQRWPIPIIYGSTYGHCIGCAIGIMVILTSSWCSKKDEKKSR